MNFGFIFLYQSNYFVFVHINQSEDQLCIMLTALQSPTTYCLTYTFRLLIFKPCLKYPVPGNLSELRFAFFFFVHQQQSRLIPAPLALTDFQSTFHHEVALVA
jgi:hypothetical protein